MQATISEEIPWALSENCVKLHGRRAEDRRERHGRGM